MKKDKLKIILESHKNWLFNNCGARADLRYADLRGADLRGADLRYADLRGAHLRGADLRYADLRGAHLRGASLRDADLRGADLRDADLRGAHLRGASLRDADLRGASTQGLHGLKILSVDNIGTYNGKSTYLPKYDIVFAGCWKGTLESFLSKGKEMNKGNPTELKNIELAYEFFKNNQETDSEKI